LWSNVHGPYGYEVHKTYSAEECLNKVKELESVVDVIFVDGKIADDRATMSIVNVKRMFSLFSTCLCPFNTARCRRNTFMALFLAPEI
jgi:hypothetical protein